ncbi:MAG: choice-of-anchor D domain-containing protein, partial [Prevotellaceae bacterium]|nr:choice-of-anchor D domain-containing protein [Prevotellaceae bacterium]
MKKHLYFSITAIIMMTVGYSSCDEKNKTIEVAGVTLSQSGSVTMTEGDKISLTAAIQPSNATLQEVSWTSSDPSVAMVSGGTLYAYKVGVATITASAGGKSASVTVTVVAKPSYSIKVSPETLAFGSLVAGYVQPEAQTVTISNTGTGPVTLSTPTAANYTITAPTPATIAPGATATFTVRPNAGLTAGTFDAVINVTGSEGTSALVGVSFEVTAVPLTYSVSALPLSLDFGSVTVGYTQPDSQTVTVTNTGTGNVTLTQPTASNFTIGAISSTVLAPTATATFTVRPNANLAAGSYDTTIKISGSENANVSIDVTFTVATPLTYTIGVSPTTLSFGSVTVGYTQPVAQTVTITNTGTGNVTLTQPTVPNYTIGELSSKEIAPNAKATFTVRPNAGLVQGVYDATIDITGENGVDASVALSFVVNVITYLNVPAWIFVDPSAATETVDVSSNVSWTAAVTTGGSWLSTSGSGTNDGSFTFDVSEHTGASERTGVITVSGGGLSQTINVTQEGVGSTTVSVADVTGNGRYDILVKWLPSLSTDPGTNLNSGRITGETIYDLYTLEGELLWRIALGHNLTSGQHHNQRN